MRKLGISIYPEHSTPDKDKEYISLAARYGFKRIFTCLLSVKGNKEEIIEKFTDIISHAKKEGMEVIFDVAPHVFPAIGASYDNLEVFAKMGAAGIRLDEGFGGQKEALMTHNPYGLQIEINISNGTKYVEQILSYGPNTDNLIGCHNFYPQEYTGLSYKYFVETSELFKKHNIRTAAFVSSKEATFGPWPVNDGLCTLEEHRRLPIVTQAKHLFATDLIDDVLIGNAYASEEELKQLSSINPNKLAFRVNVNEETSPLEKIIIEKEVHFNRGDVSDYLIRSTQSRVKYKEESFPNHDTVDIQKGDVLIGNNDFGQYKGELQIARLPMKNDGRKNVVGRIVEEEVYLLDYIKPWDYFEMTIEE
ncbi:DUF871 domain-containing protein [Bacillus testis]|uniref:DUF871 domain-containing protein n=1 Tax=Bacillus testis TaxID=1622072 RepID=UPI00067E79E4|nr:MupG family TIM beta-alpha barrel fold protein [Bacillus testis]